MVTNNNVGIMQIGARPTCAEDKYKSCPSHSTESVNTDGKWPHTMQVQLLGFKQEHIPYLCITFAIFLSFTHKVCTHTASSHSIQRSMCAFKMPLLLRFMFFWLSLHLDCSFERWLLFFQLILYLISS